MATATFTLPESVLDALKLRSEEQGQPLDVIAADALWRGLGLQDPERDPRRLITSLRILPATERFDPAKAERLAANLSGKDYRLTDALDWARGDR